MANVLLWTLVGVFWFFALGGMLSGDWAPALFIFALGTLGAALLYRKHARKRASQRAYRESVHLALRNRQASEQAGYEQYMQSLEQLKRNPGSADMRQRTLRLGRKHADVIATSMGRATFDEIALANDIYAACAGASGEPTSPAVEIEKLAKLMQRGVISLEEFERGKTLFLGAGADKAAVAVQLLNSLHLLKEQGALSESEFNMKKWDILSERLLPRRA